MGALMLMVLAVCVFCCRAAPVSNSLQVGGSPVSVQLGHTATLPCWLSPPQSAEQLEVRWFLPGGGFDSPVLLYQRAHLEHGSQYAGRVSLGLKDATSSGLREGDVSLKLANATLQDAGDYSCYVSSDKEYDRATVSLVVTESPGPPPLLSAVWITGVQVNLSCESEGWYPRPSLRWADPLKPLTPQSLQYSTAPSGLVSVHSWILLPASTRVSCWVEEQEVRLKLQEPPQGSEGGGAAGWAAFGLLLSAVLLAAAFLLYRKRGKKAKLPVEENQKLLPKGKIEPTQISTARQSYVNVKPEHNGNEYLTIVQNKIRDQQINFPDGDQVTFLTAITGTPSLSSGRHYWEVSLGNSTTGLKKFWWVGVTTASIRADSHLTPSSSNGFWFLSSSPTSLQLSTESSVALLPLPGPQTLGVFLDFDRGELSFYNVEKESLICSLTAAFTVPLFPLFNPGKGDRAPMELLQRKVEAEQGGGNTESKAVCETEAGSG
ncbi:butyrophilin subfamily 2 member A2-like [Pseudochaenichthys georgianus]|uniref:butyrophilin subfamily 2 member A2-like n=1 Tax=Pseudochaenichthys georgianus TaxID=52239 RepID=UPI00146D3EA7|nr:butyrophilin subfamily 2 member A2-like [Pseudochaenichthys georgianus]